jgi:pimeloyl-ACP methyl ester carboxylesterase
VKNGFAALIYDKRGVGKSEGSEDFANYFFFTTLAEDAAAAAKFLAQRPEILPDKIGLIGQSQGGWVAPMAATYFPSTAFLIIVSGSVSTVAEDNVFERSARLKKEGFDENEIEAVRQMHMLDLEVSRTGNGFDAFAASWEDHKSSRWFKRVYLSETPMATDHQYRLWYRTVMDYDPRPFLEQLDIPLLFIYGDAALDRFCPVTLSLERLDQLKKTGKDLTTIVVRNADHSLYLKKKDMVASPEVLSWLKSKT